MTKETEGERFTLTVRWHGDHYDDADVDEAVGRGNSAGWLDSKNLPSGVRITYRMLVYRGFDSREAAKEAGDRARGLGLCQCSAKVGE